MGIRVPTHLASLFVYLRILRRGFTLLVNHLRILAWFGLRVDTAYSHVKLMAVAVVEEVEEGLALLVE